MAIAFEVLAEPRRREILDLLRTGERPVGDVVERLTLSQPTVSKHLKVLREAGLVEVRQDAQRRWYRLRLEPLVEIDAWLAPYRELWNGSLDALERHLDAMPDEPPARSAADPRKGPASAPAAGRLADHRRKTGPALRKAPRPSAGKGVAGDH